MSASLLHGTDIAKVLSASGPVVKCVLLQHMRSDGRDRKPHPASPKADDKHNRVVLTELIEEIEVDTTPSKNSIQQILGGPFTFLGQYESEGIMVMARRELPEVDLNDMSVHELRGLCSDWGVDIKGMVEKGEMIDALMDAQLPVNPHQLQPPLDGIVVRGDILLLRVAETEEVLDEQEDKDNENENEGEESKKIKVLSNEEFFLDYTKEEYIAFASRTDVVAPKRLEDDEEEDDEDFDEGEEEEDEDYEAGEDEDDEEEKKAILNLVMSEVLRKFKEENGRGPDTRELLELRSQVAAQLGVEVTSVEAIDEINRRRSASAASESETHSPKKVKFTVDVSNGESAAGLPPMMPLPDDDDNNDDQKKKPATTGEQSGEPKET